MPGGRTVLTGAGNAITGFDTAYYGAAAMPGLTGDTLTGVRHQYRA